MKKYHCLVFVLYIYTCSVFVKLLSKNTKISVRAVRGLISRAGMVSICPLL